MMRTPLLVAMVSLSACSTQADRSAKNIHNVVLHATGAATQCIKAVDADPRYASVVANAGSSGLPTLRQLANQRVPGPEEGATILAWRQANDDCMQRPISELTDVTPEIAQLLRENVAKVDDIFLELSNGRISWGDAMAQVKQSTIAASGRLTQLVRQMQSELQAENRNEHELRARTLAAFGQGIQQAGQSIQQQEIIGQQQRIVNSPSILAPPPPLIQPPPPLIQMPIHTFCNQIGSVTNCTSQ